MLQNIESVRRAAWPILACWRAKTFTQECLIKVCGVDHVASLQMSAIGMLPKKATEAPFLRVDWKLGGIGKGLLALTKQVSLHLTNQRTILDLDGGTPLAWFGKG